MSRFVAIGSIKGITQYRQPNQTINSSEGIKRGGLFFRIGLFSPRYKCYSQCVSQTRWKANFTTCRIQESFYNHFQCFHLGTHRRNNMVNHAHLTWKKFQKQSLNRGWTSLSINRLAQAVSLALNRPYVAFPGIFALTCGRNVALAQATQDTNFVSKRNKLYMRAQDGNVYFTSLIRSMFDSLVLLLRVLYLAVLFSPSVVMAPFADIFGPRYTKVWLQVVRQTLERAGPAFIKWGQWAATRPDLFPSNVCTELSKLQTSAPEHSFAYTKKTIERAFGRKISEIFDEFEEKPVASGSIAQVHRASLRYQYRGRKIKPMAVAVKVRHPGVGESIKRDFEIINIVAKISKFIPTLKWLRLDESVQQFAVFMMSQVDLAREAAHLSRFIYNFRRWKDVSFPKPVYPLVHPAVLVETFEQGESVSYYVNELEGNERIKSALAHIGTHALLKMLLVDNFVHADMHPGNILVRVTQSKSSRKRVFKSKPHVIFLDVGMTAELSSSDRVTFLEFFKAVARRDGRTAAECTLKLSKQQNCPNPKAFIEEVKESFDFWGTAEGTSIHPAECMQQLLEKVRRHRVNVDGNVCTVMVTTLVLEVFSLFFLLFFDDELPK
ncbi:unnamed protein product [Cuscuta europaea]|uniref:ABC1 atypical kinase-like domain-containing protein n=1 Tax=Cuscuta europaea TaxID=41803 RepID=A0A9P0Z3H7_CUSEU|nr:unnamed protein product [Cuscuta europaea]